MGVQHGQLSQNAPIVVLSLPPRTLRVFLLTDICSLVVMETVHVDAYRTSQDLSCPTGIVAATTYKSIHLRQCHMPASTVRKRIYVKQSMVLRKYAPQRA